ncbi:helix-turn-helix domain-containing protein [Dysgonomonas sp. 25]|uniref:AraC family transcriptional regulator n=1 Tax=Dysgonomonas sp. 25 TaxID=2302933 RepID=UPI0013D3C68F|nr:helix-turn-helix domain-containing protein [Dysgonomonas sp. 25]NDV68732.1 AraC family transcriptional regulator [Dysgonomonas sp. 25]
MYYEHPPHPLLAPYVETYWVADGFVEGQEVMRIPPDGCIDILFTFTSTAKDGLKANTPYLVGTMTSYSEVPFQGRVEMFGIRFRPAAIAAFVRLPAYEYTNGRVDMSLENMVFDNCFYDNLSGLTSMGERVLYINNYLLSKLPFANEPDRQIIYATDLIRKSGGLLSTAAVAETTCLSERQLQRRFKAAVGISPKMFSKVMRFKHARHYIRQHPEANLYTIAFDCGYYDHAHLIKDFKDFEGGLPSDFREQ